MVVLAKKQSFAETRCREKRDVTAGLWWWHWWRLQPRSFSSLSCCEECAYRYHHCDNYYYGSNGECPCINRWSQRNIQTVCDRSIALGDQILSAPVVLEQSHYGFKLLFGCRVVLVVVVRQSFCEGCVNGAPCIVDV